MTIHSPMRVKSSLETDISERTFNRIVELSQKEAGIVLSSSKAPMVKSRLTRRLRKLGIPTFDEYLEYLESADGIHEMNEFISALTTNVTQFFREDHHFEFIQSEIWTKLKTKLDSGQKVRVWSAGCSNGQEPYTLAMTFMDCDPTIGSKDFKILASDIDLDVLNTAKQAEYSEDQISGIPEAYRNKFLTRFEQTNDMRFKVADSVRSLVTFRRLNLNRSFPMKGCFDLIMCRNVMIYFDETTQNSLLTQFAKRLEPGGWLMIGHSERLPEQASKLYTNVGVTTYQAIQLQDQE